MGLLQNPGKVVGGSITFDGEDILAYDEEQMRNFRGNKVSMIFQNPMTCLNPVYNFENFIEGSCNRLGRSAGLSIAANPGRSTFNPLFIYGGPGLAGFIVLLLTDVCLYSYDRWISKEKVFAVSL